MFLKNTNKNKIKNNEKYIKNKQGNGFVKLSLFPVSKSNILSDLPIVTLINVHYKTSLKHAALLMHAIKGRSEINSYD